MFAFCLCVVMAAGVGSLIFGGWGALIFGVTALLGLGYAALTTNWFR